MALQAVPLKQGPSLDPLRMGLAVSLTRPAKPSQGCRNPGVSLLPHLVSIWPPEADFARVAVHPGVLLLGPGGAAAARSLVFHRPIGSRSRCRSFLQLPEDHEAGSNCRGLGVLPHGEVALFRFARLRCCSLPLLGAGHRIGAMDSGLRLPRWSESSAWSSACVDACIRSGRSGGNMAAIILHNN